MADEDGRVVGCGALHPLWEDLAEIRTLAVSDGARPAASGTGSSTASWRPRANSGVSRVFVLTFEVDFFSASRVRADRGRSGHPDVYEELRRSFDEGVAEFLDLERVKPNTLGNTRMLLHL